MINLNKLINDHIIIDRIDTWPDSISKLFEANLSLMRSYFERKAEIDYCLQEHNFYFQKPANKYDNDYGRLLLSIEDKLLKTKILGFHCSRLTNTEITYIKENGLYPLSHELRKWKLDLLLDNCIITEEEYNRLLNTFCKLTNAFGCSYFFMFAKTLREDYSGLSRLLTLWGGEAIYKAFLGDKKMKGLLSSIGTPCILLGSLRYNDSSKLKTIPEIMCKLYMYIEHRLELIINDIDVWTEKTIKIIGIITCNNPLFEELTYYSTWPLNWLDLE